jgi:hypothetical protein
MPAQYLITICHCDNGLGIAHLRSKVPLSADVRLSRLYPVYTTTVPHLVLFLYIHNANIKAYCILNA